MSVRNIGISRYPGLYVGIPDEVFAQAKAMALLHVGVTDAETPARRDWSDAIAEGGMAQTAIPPNAGRIYLLLANFTGADLWWSENDDATMGEPSQLLTPGTVALFIGEDTPSGTISVVGAQPGASYSALDG